MKDRETNGSPTEKQPCRPSEGGERREGTEDRLVGMSGREIRVTPGDLTLFQDHGIMILNNETYAA